MKTEKMKIFLVDDDAVFLRLLAIEFGQHGDFAIETFATGELCIAQLVTGPDMIILDYYLDTIDKTAMNGLNTLDQIKAFNPAIPVVMLSCQDSIDVAVNCMHHKVLDYVVKSETSFMRLKNIISTLLQHQKLEKELHWYMDRM